MREKLRCEALGISFTLYVLRYTFFEAEQTDEYKEEHLRPELDVTHYEQTDTDKCNIVNVRKCNWVLENNKA
jgi:hypothetical protein